MLTHRIERMFESIVERTLKSVRQEGKPVLTALDEHWTALRNTLVQQSPKDAFTLLPVEGELGQKLAQVVLAQVVKEHQLPEHFLKGPIVQRQINSSVRAEIHKNIPMVRIMDLIKGLFLEGQHTRVIFSKYATPNGLADDFSGFLMQKGSKKLSESVAQSGNGKGFLVRLSDTESVLLLHEALPEPLVKVVKGIRHLLEGLSEWKAQWLAKKTVA